MCRSRRYVRDARYCVSTRMASHPSGGWLCFAFLPGALRSINPQSEIRASRLPSSYVRHQTSDFTLPSVGFVSHEGVFVVTPQAFLTKFGVGWLMVDLEIKNHTSTIILLPMAPRHKRTDTSAVVTGPSGLTGQDPRFSCVGIVQASYFHVK